MLNTFCKQEQDLMYGTKSKTETDINIINKIAE